MISIKANARPDAHFLDKISPVIGGEGGEGGRGRGVGGGGGGIKRDQLKELTIRSFVPDKCLKGRSDNNTKGNFLHAALKRLYHRERI